MRINGKPRAGLSAAGSAACAALCAGLRLAHDAKFGTDHLTRTAIARSNMFENTPEETKYVFTENDTEGKPLDGSHLYSITFAAGELPPVNGFWTLTLCNEFYSYNPTRSAGTRWAPSGPAAGS